MLVLAQSLQMHTVRYEPRRVYNVCSPERHRGTSSSPTAMPDGFGLHAQSLQHLTTACTASMLFAHRIPAAALRVQDTCVAAGGPQLCAQALPSPERPLQGGPCCPRHDAARYQPAF